MKNKILLLAILLGILPLVSAATINMTAPAAGSNNTGTVVFNVTWTNHSTIDLVNAIAANTSFYYNSSGTDTAISATETITNNSIFASIDTTALTDGIYTIKALVGNATKTKWSEVNLTIVTWDNTDPACTLATTYSTIAWKGTQIFTWTSSDGLQLVSTATTIDRPGTGSTLSYTSSSETLTLASNETNYIGDWTATTVATDRSGNTATCTKTFKSYLPDGPDTPGYEPEPTQDGSKLLLIGIVAVILWLIFKKKR